MTDNGLFRRRDLPHIDVEGKASFITGCLDGSIPASGLKRIREYRDALNSRPRPESLSEADWELKKHKLVFQFVDSILDVESAVKYLSDDRLAEIVQNAFLHFAEERYHLFAFVVMPSHHHWLFLPKADWAEEFAIRQIGKMVRTPRESISHSIQSYTGSQCNRLLGRTGSFWQTETFDHYARDETELYRILHYIEQNPVVAGLVGRAEDYRWSSAYLRPQQGLQPGQVIAKCGIGFQPVSQIDEKILNSGITG
jgi:REP element-mobilizing transposase RayT